jgi:hypothetical protein
MLMAKIPNFEGVDVGALAMNLKFLQQVGKINEGLTNFGNALTIYSWHIDETW